MTTPLAGDEAATALRMLANHAAERAAEFHDYDAVPSDDDTDDESDSKSLILETFYK